MQSHTITALWFTASLALMGTAAAQEPNSRTPATTHPAPWADQVDESGQARKSDAAQTTPSGRPLHSAASSPADKRSAAHAASADMSARASETVTTPASGTTTKNPKDRAASAASGGSASTGQNQSTASDDRTFSRDAHSPSGRNWGWIGLLGLLGLVGLFPRRRRYDDVQAVPPPTRESRVRVYDTPDVA